MNADNGKVIGALPTGAGTDASLFDPATGNAFASAGVDHFKTGDPLKALRLAQAIFFGLPSALSPS